MGLWLLALSTSWSLPSGGFGPHACDLRRTVPHAASRCARTRYGHPTVMDAAAAAAAATLADEEAAPTVVGEGSVTADAVGVVVPTMTATDATTTSPLQLLDGDVLEKKWDKLRGGTKRASFRRSLALQRFFVVASWKTIRANMTNDELRTNVTAAWVRDGLLNLGPTMCGARGLSIRRPRRDAPGGCCLPTACHHQPLPAPPAQARRTIESCHSPRIKLGQVFSSRTDLLHPAYCEALESLQTAVPCVSGQRVRELLEAELGTPLPFDSFDDTPLAGASLGQVHRAVYKGTPVAVKIQRAGLKNMFDTDFKNIRMGCRVMNALERGYEKVRRWQGKSKAAADRDWMEYANDASRLVRSHSRGVSRA